ncbi:MAG: Sec-independent protein secretion pathway component [Microbacterium sp.]|jgi:sec-independent protein translocase protein TatA|nr:Sec-independent protein secretion pathway component [Microbacterium sp.]
MLQNLTGWHALIVLAIVVLIFGAAKLPALARSLGQSVRILKTEVGDPPAETAASPASDTAVQVPAENTSRSPVLAPPSTS